MINRVFALLLLVTAPCGSAQTAGEQIDAQFEALDSAVALSWAQSQEADSEHAEALEALTEALGALEERVAALEEGGAEPDPPEPEIQTILIHAFGDERQPARDASVDVHAGFADLHDIAILRSDNAVKIPRWQETNPDIVPLMWLNYPMRADGDRTIALDSYASAPIWEARGEPVLLLNWEEQHSGLHDFSDAGTRDLKAWAAADRLSGTPFLGAFLDNALIPCRAEQLASARAFVLVADGMSPIVPDGYRGDEAESEFVIDGLHQLGERVEVLAINPGVIVGQVDLINRIGPDWAIEEHAFTAGADRVWDQIQAAREIEAGRMMHAYLPERYFRNADLRRFWWACLACCRTDEPLSGSLYPVADSVSASRAAYQESWVDLAAERDWAESLGAAVSIGRVDDVITAEFETGLVTISLRTRSVEVQ